MKRPSGFTPQRPTPPDTTAPDPVRREPERQRAPESNLTEPTLTEPIAITRPARSEPPIRVPGVRQARRERKRVERSEVKRFTAHSRRRRRNWLLAVGGVAGLALLACGLAYTPILSVRTIQVEGAERVSSDAIVADLSSQLGSPFPLVDESAIKAALVTYPLIESYSIEARPPDTLVLRLVERTPVGAIDTGDGFTIVDAAGVVIESGASRPGAYPLIAVDGGTEADGFVSAAAVLRALPAELFARVDSVTATTTDDVRFTLRDSDTTVVWGSAEESALKAYTLDALIAAQPDYDEYDVSSPSVAVVR
ncbi:cell division protein FtsQ [Mycetocola sp. CAN_C7]|uniref:FtsQ-type POTRA domain-containing protein n=1 Tax=Mycetocola sp. CAN_C7 TaxID=2787724 RepID=UPI0018C9B0DC